MQHLLADGPLVLLCHNLPMIAAALAAGTARQLACKNPGNGDADGGDRSLHMAFRPDREIRGVGNLRVAEIARRMGLVRLLRGEKRPAP